MAKFKFEGNQPSNKQAAKKRLLHIDEEEEEDDLLPAEEEYNVEYLYGKKFENGQIKYCVKWENYSLEESSYEPVENLQNVLYNMRGFEKRMSDLIFKVALLQNAKKKLPQHQVTSVNQISQFQQIAEIQKENKPQSPSSSSNFETLSSQKRLPLIDSQKQSPEKQALTNGVALQNSQKLEIPDVHLVNNQNQGKSISVNSIPIQSQLGELPQHQMQQQQEKRHSLNNSQQDNINGINNGFQQPKQQNQQQQNNVSKQQSHVYQQNSVQQTQPQLTFKQPNPVNHQQQQNNSQQNGRQSNNQNVQNQNHIQNQPSIQTIQQNKQISHNQNANQMLTQPKISQFQNQEKQQKSNSTDRLYQTTIDQSFSQSLKQAQKNGEQEEKQGEIQKINQQKNKGLLQFRDPILENELKSNGYQMQMVLDENSKYGNFNNGDIPLKILKHAPYTKVQKVMGNNIDLPSSLYFKVEFKQRPSGNTPHPSYIAFSELKERYPRVLMEYYEQYAILLDPIPNSSNNEIKNNQTNNVKNQSLNNNNSLEHRVSTRY